MLEIRAPNWRAKRFKEMGRGGEAVIYSLKPDTVAKIFLKSTDKIFAKDMPGQEAAAARLVEMQKKLRAFPQNAPPGLIGPSGILTDEFGHIFGYVMPLVDGISFDKLTRVDSLLSLKDRAEIIINFHDLLTALHEAEIVYGDLNQNNIIIVPGRPAVNLIDADSIQFGEFFCRSFMPGFAAPEILKINLDFNQQAKPTPNQINGWTINSQKRDANGRFIKIERNPQAPLYSLAAPHSKLTDWYAFLVNAMRLLTFTEPYGGTVNSMTQAERIKKHVTVFNPNVIYPYNARPLRELPRPILEVFFRVFQQGERFVPEKSIFESLY